MKNTPKTLVYLTAVVLLTGFAHAQNSTAKNGETILPEEGDYALGFDSDPFLNYVGNFLNQGSSTPSTQPFGTTDSTVIGKMFQDAQRAYQGRMRLGFGRHSGVYGDPVEVHSSYFGFIGIDGSLRVTDYLTLNLDVHETYFEDAPLARSDSDNWIHNYALGANLDRDMGSGRLQVNSSVYYGGFASLNHGDYTRGITEHNRILYNGNNRYSYRFDGNPLGATGWEFTTGIRTRLYNEAGEDLYDYLQLKLTQSINYRISDNLTFWNNVTYQNKDWDGSPEADSDGFRFATGLSGKLCTDMRYRIGICYEERSYNTTLADDRNELGYEALLYGTSYNWDWRLFVNHGLQDRNISNSFQTDLFEPRGTRCGASAERRITNDVRLNLFFDDLHTDGWIMGTGLESRFTSGGVELEKELGSNSSIGAVFSLQRIEYKSGGSKVGDTSNNFGVYYNRKF